MYIDEFECIKEQEHYQFNHINIEKEEFYKLFIDKIFEDELLYKYLTEYDANDMLKYQIKHNQIVNILIGFIVNLKKEYLLQSIPIDIRKEYCKQLKPKINGNIIDVNKEDWESKFEEYLNNNINGIDVLGEIILSKILEEKFNADVLISKLALSTNQNSKVFGIDTVHYSSIDNSIYFGESKFTSNIELGVEQHKAELILLDYKIKQEIKLMFTKNKSIRGNNEIINKIIGLSKKIMESEESIADLLEKNEISNIYIAFFIMHGENYNYDISEEKLNKLKEKYNFKNFIPIYITLPIVSKEELSEKIKEKIEEIRKNANY